MTDKPLTPEEMQKAIKEIAETYEIDTDQIFYVSLANGQEFFGELFNAEPELEEKDDDVEDEELEIEIILEDEEETDDLMFLHPLKIVSDHFVGSDGTFIQNNFFVEYNMYSNNPFCYINKKNIVSMDPVNKVEPLYEYMTALDSNYMDGISEYMTSIEFGPKPEIQINKDNVVNFQDYKDKKKS